MKALILCAGEGARLRPLTEKIPKPMILINKKPLLEYNIELLKSYGVKEIAINTSYLPEKIKEYFGDGSKFGVKLKYSYEPKLLGTAGALNNFRNFFNETFVILYGDIVTNLDIGSMIKNHNSLGGIATLALRKNTLNKNSGGFVTMNKNFQVKKFIEKSNTEKRENCSIENFWKNSGIYVLEPDVIKYIPNGFSDFGKDIFPKILESKRKVFGYDMKDYYFREVGEIKKYETAKKEIESGLVELDFNKNKAIFLDRDGVINENVYETDGKIMAPATLDQLKIIPNVKEGLAKMKELGFKIILITNQPGISQGYLSKEKLNQINEFLKKELGIDEVYSCPHYPKITGECDCRKPKIGLIKQAVNDFNINLQKSYMVGDSLSDIQTGQNANVKKTFLVGIVREDVLDIEHKKNVFPDYTLPNLIKIAKKIEDLERKKP